MLSKIVFRIRSKDVENIWVLFWNISFTLINIISNATAGNYVSLRITNVLLTN